MITFYSLFLLKYLFISTTLDKVNCHLTDEGILFFLTFLFDEKLLFEL